MTLLSRLFVLLLPFFFSLAASAQPMTRDEVPAPLQPWVDWVLHKKPELNCPANYNNGGRRCIWPGALRISANQHNARFAQSLAVYKKSRITLPGNSHHWPSDVRVDQKPVALVSKQGRPAIVLEPGNYLVTGRFEWARMPDHLDVPAGTGMLALEIDGKPMPVHRRANRLRLLLDGKTNTSDAPEDNLHIRVARLISDGRPLTITTAFTLRVSGRQREVTLPDVLLEGGVAMQLESKLPARLDADGRLTMQLRPGQWQVQVTERHPGPIASLSAPAHKTVRGSGGTSEWPYEEIWVWKAAPDVRVAELSGPEQIDPRLTELPSDWRGLPTYRQLPGQTLDIKTIRRGDPTPEPDQLNLQRNLWLDFNGKGFSVQDQINGRLTSTWRLETQPELTLGQARLNGKPQFITRVNEQASEGLEVRRGGVQLMADSRLERENQVAGLHTTIPALGWQHDFQKVGAVLHTPPGWKVLAVSGVDRAGGAWLDAWTLYDLFLVLIVAIAAGRLFGWPWAIVSCALLTLLWHEPNAPRFMWLVVLVPIALYRTAPASGRLARGLQFCHWLAMAALIIIILPFVVNQARTALHPQLESTKQTMQVSPDWTDAGPVHAELAAVQEMEDSVDRPEMADIRRVQKSRYAKSSSVGVSASAPLRNLDLTDPKALVQTGPGIPDWSWNSTSLIFNGPVLATQQLTITLLSPTMKRLAHWLILILTGLLVWRIAGLQRAVFSRLSKSATAASGLMAMTALATLALQLMPANVHAADFPSETMLAELERRLTEQDLSSPRASVTRMNIDVGATELTLSLSVNSLERTVLPIPADTQRLLPLRVAIDGVNADDRILADKKGQIWILAPAGNSLISLRLKIPPLNQIELSLPLVPNKITSNTGTWTLSGVDVNGVPGPQLTLTRQKTGTAAVAQDLEPVDLPPLLEVTRVLRLGLSWEVHTNIRRISPVGAPVSVNVSLLPGEQVTTPGITVKDQKVTARLSADQRQHSWISRLEVTDQISLSATAQEGLYETWQLQAGPLWRVETAGIAPVHHQDKHLNWLPTWKPWPGEKVELTVSRPAGVAGQVMTIDKSLLTVQPGIRASDSTLKFTLRSSQGGQHNVQIPADAILQNVRINGQTRPVRQDGRTVTLPVVPGAQEVELEWREVMGVASLWHVPSVDLGTPHVNAKVTVHFPRDRWTLWAKGPTLGPAVLFWGVLLVLLVVSIVLGRFSRGRLPIGTISCFLLLVGMSQVPMLAPIVVVVWFAFTAARSRLLTEASPLVYNSTQIVGAGLTLIALGALLTAVQQGLLGQPDMQIAGYASSASRLNWYLDRSNGLTPEISVISVPLLAYRVLMLLWALWLAWSALNWARWGWQQFSIGGLWRQRPPKNQPTIDPDAPPPGSANVQAPTSEVNPPPTETPATTPAETPASASNELSPRELAKLAAESLRKPKT